MSTEIDANDTRRCQNCDSFVSSSFRRVFGDNDDVVYACSSCTIYRDVFTGAAGTPEESR